MEKDNKSSGGIDGLTLLFLIFLTLKLGGWGVVATWSYWWVCSPIWLPIAIAVLVLVIAAIVEKILN